MCSREANSSSLGAANLARRMCGLGCSLTTGPVETKLSKIQSDHDDASCALSPSRHSTLKPGLQVQGSDACRCSAFTVPIVQRGMADLFLLYFSVSWRRSGETWSFPCAPRTAEKPRLYFLPFLPLQGLASNRVFQTRPTLLEAARSMPWEPSGNLASRGNPRKPRRSFVANRSPWA